jgi:hypothetical protein
MYNRKEEKTLKRKKEPKKEKKAKEWASPMNLIISFFKASISKHI